jgi:hypothetical protein
MIIINIGTIDIFNTYLKKKLLSWLGSNITKNWKAQTSLW